VREPEVDAELEPAPHDLRLRHLDEGRADREALVALGAGCRRDARERLERGEEGRPAVGYPEESSALTPIQISRAPSVSAQPRRRRGRVVFRAGRR
jgi:hypothetical protein